MLNNYNAHNVRGHISCKIETKQNITNQFRLQILKPFFYYSRHSIHLTLCQENWQTQPNYRTKSILNFFLNPVHELKGQSHWPCRYRCINILRLLFGVSCFVLRVPFVIGLVVFPFSIHPAIADLSYVYPSEIIQVHTLLYLHKII